MPQLSDGQNVSLCLLYYNVVLENHSVHFFPGGGGLLAAHGLQ